MAEQILVSIKCWVFNHEPYLRECLNGFVIQKTSFKFEAIIHDDASTDNSAEIIKEYAKKYPDIIKPIYEKENQYSKQDGSLTKIMNNACRGKYIAMCEGDDYWTDPYKLQKQVDFLEANPDYGLVHTKCSYNKDGIIRPKQDKVKISEGFVFNDLLTHKFYISALTVCIRKELSIQCEKTNHKERLKKKWKMSDYPLWLEAALHTKFKFLPDDTATYRVLPESASHSKDKFKNYKFFKSIYDIKFYFFKKTNSDKKTKNIILCNYYKGLLSYSRYDLKNSFEGLLYLLKRREITLEMILRYFKNLIF